jgi:PleD family two-component response regulator
MSEPTRQTPEGNAVKKILVIDDSETIRQQVRQALAACGYEIIEATKLIDSSRAVAA